MGNKRSKHKKQTNESPPKSTYVQQPTKQTNSTKLKNEPSDQKMSDPITNKKMRRSKKKVEDEFAGTLVMDNGSYLIRAGFCGDSSPRAVFPPVVGRPKHPNIMVDQKNVYVGDEAVAKRGILNNNYAIKNSIIDHWDDMVEIWRHTFYNELRITPEEHPLLLTESPLNPKQNREKTVEIIFEQFNIPSLYLANTSLCSIIASGRSNAIVLESGYQCTHIVPIYNGFVLKNAIRKLNIGGMHVTQYLMQLLTEKGYTFTTHAEQQIIEIMKHDLGFIALDYADELHTAETASRLSKSYELPDGQVIGFDAINISRFKCTECLFQPSMINIDKIGISKLLYEATKWNGKYIMDMCSNIIISGGNTKLDGFSERIEHNMKQWINKNDTVLMDGYVRMNNSEDISTDIVELICKYNPQLKVKCIAPPERSYSVWIGGSVLVTTLPNDWYITKDDYEEYGVAILDKKCT